MKHLMALPLLTASVIAAALAILLAGVMHPVSGYTRVLAANWHISLPHYAGEVYAAEEDESWLGDGNRYHVFRYSDKAAIAQAVGWQSGDTKEIRAAVEAIIGVGTVDGTGIAGLNVPQDKKPDYGRCRWFALRGRDDFRNRLYLLLNGDTLYVVEQFF